MAEGVHEIIIVKRRGDEEEGHHGGAWKIALADFMTAMMALFLVLWLIGSTTKETKTAIAEYFNPVKLADVTFDRRGLRDPTNTPGEAPSEGELGKMEGGKGDTGKGEGAKGDAKGDAKGGPGSRAREAALFQDPYAVLAKLAAEADPDRNDSADGVITEAGQPGINGGEAARDPFDPLYWQVAPVAKMRAEAPGTPNTVAPLPQDGRLDARSVNPLRTAPVTPPVKAATAVAPAEPAAVAEMAAAPPAAAPEVKRETALEPAKAEPVRAEPVKPALSKAAPLAADRARDAAEAAETLAAAQIKDEIAKALASLGTASPAPRTEVRRTGEGILISLTDEANFSMFGVGSAEPQAKVVKALERIAGILKDRPGRIVVRGHTDARPFRSETYDNWRLSSARAQMASYMLVRGGVADARLERIEGYADRLPRNPADPKAAENRRIEILLRGRPE
ncbi:MotB family protein [Methylobacterium sp. Leaf466]|uniref:MotB family protein n=1 Tax=Methylobacterium sp. Leaf466 TaxID=1736386 RepID=UPI0006F8FA26|nr:MotB family protein [Methylobacterium sp. Leaf466]KQT87569.1 hypothetical protein ASG59_15975 [Methylobacterium sp. Leaf466]